MFPLCLCLCSSAVGLQVAMNVYELSSAAGLPCEIDPALVVALSSQKSGKTHTHTHTHNLHPASPWALSSCSSMCVRAENISPEEEYKIACLLMVFVAVSLPTLASNVMSQYSPAIEGRMPCCCVLSQETTRHDRRRKSLLGHFYSTNTTAKTQYSTCSLLRTWNERHRH